MAAFPPRIYQIPYRYLIRQQVLQQHADIHRVLDGLVRGYGDPNSECTRFRGREVALVAAHEMVVKELERNSYVHDSPLDETLEEYIFYPELTWPDPTPDSCALEDIMVVAQKWIKWAERGGGMNQLCWNRGRQPLFQGNALEARTSRAATAGDIHRAEIRLYREFTEDYVVALETVMDKIEFAHFAQRENIEMRTTVGSLVEGTRVLAWIDPRGHLMPALAFDLDSRCVLVEPHEFSRVLQ